MTIYAYKSVLVTPEYLDTNSTC